MSENKDGPAEAVTFRMSPELTARLDRHVEKLRKKTGLRVTRSSAIARFVEIGLRAEERRK